MDQSLRTVFAETHVVEHALDRSSIDRSNNDQCANFESDKPTITSKPFTAHAMDGESAVKYERQFAKPQLDQTFPEQEAQQGSAHPLNAFHKPA